MSLFGDSFDLMGDVLNDVVGVEVLYLRGDDKAYRFEMIATVGATTFVVEQDNAYVNREYRDYLFQADDLSEELLANPTSSVAEDGLPKKRDRVVEIVGDEAIVYEVRGPVGVSHFQYSDTSRKRVRVHTQKLTVEDASDWVLGTG